MHQRRSGHRLILVVTLLLIGGGVALYAVASIGASNVHTIPLDAHPGTLTLDAAHGHAFIATYSLYPNSNELNPDTGMSAIDVRSGKRVWTAEVGFEPTSTLVDGRNNRLVLGGGNQLLILDTQTGHVVPNAFVGGSLSGAALDASRHHLYVVQSSGTAAPDGLSIFDARTGTLLRQTSFDPTQMLYATIYAGDPLIDDRTGRVFVPITGSTYEMGATRNMTDSIVVFDAGGRLLRRVTIAHFSGQGNSSPNLLNDPVRRRLVVVDPNAGDVVTIDIDSGRTVRRLHLGRYPTQQGNTGVNPFSFSLIDAQAGRAVVTTLGRVVCGTGVCTSVAPFGRLYLLDTRSGRVLRHLLPGLDPVKVAMTLDPSEGCMLAVVSRNPGAALMLYVLDARSGATRHRLALPPGGYPFVDAPSGRIYIVSQGGTVSRFDPHSGRLLESITVPQLSAFGQGVTVVDGKLVIMRDTPTALAPDPLGWMPGWIRQRLPWHTSDRRVAPGSISIIPLP